MPPANELRVVVDTNIVLRGLLNRESASGIILGACDRRELLIVLSKAALAECREVLRYPSIVEAYPELTLRKVELALRRLRYVGDVVDTSHVRFDLPRDPKEAKWVELCIAGEATHLITGDKDLLYLPSGRDDASKRFRQRMPQLKITRPADFLREWMAVGK